MSCELIGHPFEGNYWMRECRTCEDLELCKSMETERKRMYTIGHNIIFSCNIEDELILDKLIKKIDKYIEKQVNGLGETSIGYGIEDEGRYSDAMDD